ncbi:MAG TPA: PIN domain nuclease [Alphaproteobacteria bacterium]|nr:PIN domain nuclease [Alphaproteobacteria bacterium]HAJ47327.1 PIN domain nuclease [Alphaproteobacteria bacterium]
MRLLLDTHFVIAILERRFERDYPRYAGVVLSDAAAPSVSVASLWEIAIKTRIGKLDLNVRPDQVAQFCQDAGFGILPINEQHFVAVVDPDPPMKDPFDRLLLAQAQAEGMKLVTLDRVLAGHPQAWRP